MVAAVATQGASRAAGPAPKPSASPSGSPSPAPTATPQPLDIAIPRLEARVKADASDKGAAIELASDYLSVGRADLTLGLTQKLLAGGTKTAQVYYLDGVANSAAGKLQESLASFEQAANLEPTNMAVLQSLSSTYLRANRPDDAERIAKRALTFNKDNKEAYENYGFVFAAQKKYDQAREQFEAAAKLDPKDPHPVVLEARTYAEQNAVALASQLFDRAVSIGPDDLEALAGKAEVAAQQHDVKTAVATYEKILALQQNDLNRAAAMIEIAKLYAVEKMDSDAEATFQKIISTYPTVTASHVVYGDYLQGKNDLAGAEREWTTALGPNRDNPDALARLGALATSKKDFAKAVDQYKRLTEVAPKDPRSHLLLAGAYMNAQNFTAARDSFRQSYAIDRTPDALVGLADADYETKNYKEAVEILSALDKQVPELVKANPQLLYRLGQAYQASNDAPLARDAYTRFLTFLDPSSQGYKDVKKLVDSLGNAAPHASPSPKPKPKPSASPQH